jgi:hypothetical protein
LRFWSAPRCSARRGGRRRFREATILCALFFALFMATFGLVCAALALTPLHPAPDGTWTIGGVAGFVTSEPMPWWARIVAGFFAIVCLGSAVLGLRGLARGLFGRSPEGGAGPPE